MLTKRVIHQKWYERNINMTDIYFVRHAQSDISVHDDRSRPLTEKGLQDRGRVTAFLEDKGVTVMASSPYKRAYDTIEQFARKKGIGIICIEDFRERRLAEEWIEDFMAFSKDQWEDFTYKRAGGESLQEVQKRNVDALFGLLQTYPDQTMVIGTHGTALSTIIHCFDPSYGFVRFMEMKGLMPWIVHFQFDGSACISINPINLFD